MVAQNPRNPPIMEGYVSIMTVSVAERASAPTPTPVVHVNSIGAIARHPILTGILLVHLAYAIFPNQLDSLYLNSRVLQAMFEFDADLNFANTIILIWSWAFLWFILYFIAIGMLTLVRKSTFLQEIVEDIGSHWRANQEFSKNKRIGHAVLMAVIVIFAGLMALGAALLLLTIVIFASASFADPYVLAIGEMLHVDFDSSVWLVPGVPIMSCVIFIVYQQANRRVGWR